MLSNPSQSQGDRAAWFVTPRVSVNADNSIGTSTLRLTYGTAPATKSYTKMRMGTGATAAAATPSLARFGVYSVAANGDIALVAAIASDTTLFAGTNAMYERSFTAPFDAVAGQRYAIGVVVVTGATAPALKGNVLWLSVEAGIADRQCGFVAAQTDLPASVVAASISDSTVCYYASIVP